MIHEKDNLSNSKKILFLKLCKTELWMKLLLTKLLPPSHQGQYNYLKLVLVYNWK